MFGRWDDTKGDENIDFMPTILSRFDMIFIVKDEHDEHRDMVSVESLSGVKYIHYKQNRECRVPTRHRKPGKLQFYFSGLKNSWNLRKMPKLMENICQ